MLTFPPGFVKIVVGIKTIQSSWCYFTIIYCFALTSPRFLSSSSAPTKCLFLAITHSPYFPFCLRYCFQAPLKKLHFPSQKLVLKNDFPQKSHAAVFHIGKPKAWKEGPGCAEWLPGTKILFQPP